MLSFRWFSRVVTSSRDPLVPSALYYSMPLLCGTYCVFNKSLYFNLINHYNEGKLPHKHFHTMLSNVWLTNKELHSEAFVVLLFSVVGKSTKTVSFKLITSGGPGTNLLISHHLCSHVVVMGFTPVVFSFFNLLLCYCVLVLIFF